MTTADLTLNPDELLANVTDLEDAHRVIEALAKKFELSVIVQSNDGPAGIPVTVTDIENALQAAVDTHEDAAFRDAMHELWDGVVEALLDSPAITQHDGSLIAANYTTVEDLIADYMLLLTTGPWSPLLALVPEEGETVGFVHGVFGSLVEAYREAERVKDRPARDVVDADALDEVISREGSVMIGSYNLFYINPDTNEPALRVVP